MENYKEQEKTKNGDAVEKLLKEVQEEQMRLHPELYDNNKNGGN